MKLLNGDCFSLMEEIEDGTIDLVLTDPPYEIETGGGGIGKNREYMNELNFIKEGIDVEKLLEVISYKFKKDTFNGVFFCSTKQLIKYLNYSQKNNYNYVITLWHKTNPPPLCNNKYLSDVEFCVCINKNKPILGQFHTKSLLYKSSINKSDKEKYNHPTVKPVKLLQKYLINHSIEGDLVLDPFMGTGSTGEACKNLNRNFIGIELDKGHFNTAKNRLTSICLEDIF